MKCPVCKGKNLGNPPSNIGGSFNMPCKTCGGTGEVDKIQEALIKHNNKGEFAFSNDIEITEREWDEALDSYFKAGYKSRDEEFKKLKDLTEDLLLTLVKYGIKQSEDVIEALKEIT